MPEEETFLSSNINAIWMQNVYENLKNLENMERLAREGCISILEYVQIPFETRPLIIADIQYKNLRLMVSEIHLLLTDLTPMVEEDKLIEFRKEIENMDRIINLRKLFVKERISQSRGLITATEVTPFFRETLKFISLIRISIVNEIAPLLYLKEEQKLGFGRR